MCLAIPGRVSRLVAESGDDPLRLAEVDFGGVSRETALVYVPEAGPGDWVIVHAGFAISLLEPEEAAATLDELRRLAAVDGATDRRAP